MLRDNNLNGKSRANLISLQTINHVFTAPKSSKHCHLKCMTEKFLNYYPLAVHMHMTRNGVTQLMARDDRSRIKLLCAQILNGWALLLPDLESIKWRIQSQTRVTDVSEKS